LRFLQNKLVEIREGLEKSEVALNDYRRRTGIVPGLISVDGKEAVVLDRLKDLSKDLTAAQVQRIGLEPQVELISKHQYASLPAVTRDATVQALDRELNQLYGESASYSSQFKSGYPPLTRLHAKINEVQVHLTAETVKLAQGLRAQYQDALSKENKLQAEMQRQRTETLKLNDAAAEYTILQRDADTSRELYNAVLTRIKDVALSSGSDTTNVAVINSAEVPLIPTRPNKMREMLLALVLGLSGGVGVAFLLEYIDNTLKNPEEAENYLRLPNLGVVPEFSTISARPAYGAVPMVKDGSVTTLPSFRELVTLHHSYSSLGEAYRNLRTALLLSRAGAPPRMMLITSATSREGKTVTAVNIAAMLAQLGGDTLLIDADLRRARCHRVLAVNNHPGLTEVLTGARELHEVIQSTEVDNLYLLSAGSVPPNPTELLGSARMEESLKRLHENCEFVVIDSSPVLPVSDALLLAKLVDGVIVVANGTTTPRQQIRSACARIEYARGKILGVVLNRIKVNNPEYRYYYHHEYYTLSADDHPHEAEFA
jgi:succinoglycan biosynthesis transport protein ExoP